MANYISGYDDLDELIIEHLSYNDNNTIIESQILDSVQESDFSLIDDITFFLMETTSVDDYLTQTDENYTDDMEAVIDALSDDDDDIIDELENGISSLTN